MKRKIKKIVSVVVMVGVIASNVVMGASIKREVISIPKLGNGETARSATRTLKYSYVQAACWAVYPIELGKTDNFTKIRVVIRNSSNKLISSTTKAPCNSSGETVLTEGSGTKNIYLNEGYLDTKNIKFCFYGNSSNYPAKADVSYYGN